MKPAGLKNSRQMKHRSTESKMHRFPTTVKKQLFSYEKIERNNPIVR